MKPRKIARRITPEYLHNAALYYLERYAASTGRLQRVLTQKIERSCRDHPDQNKAELLPLIAREIQTLTRVELLNDDRLAAQFVDGYRARGMPIRMIAQKLKQKGFTPDLIAHLISGTNSETQSESEFAAAQAYLARRKLWPFLRTDTDDRTAIMKARKKAWAALARMGYDSDVIEQAMTPGSAMPE